MKSRYADNPGVNIDEGYVPAEFRPLLALACTWAIGDDVERDEFMNSSTIEAKKEMVDAVYPHFDSLAAWSATENQKIPVRDEAILLDMLAEAAAEALYDVYPDGR